MIDWDSKLQQQQKKQKTKKTNKQTKKHQTQLHTQTSNLQICLTHQLFTTTAIYNFA